MTRKKVISLATVLTAVFGWTALQNIGRDRAQVAIAQEVKKAAERQPIILDTAPVRILRDTFPTLNGIAVDEERGEVFIGNDNKGMGASILAYRVATPTTDRITEPLRRIAGPQTMLGKVCGLGISPEHRELYFVNNDEDNFGAFPLDANGNVAPAREMVVPHGAWGVFLEPRFDELFITVEHVNQIAVYPRTAVGEPDPLRTIQGPRTELADPHGIYVDARTNEIYVTNHGHWRRTERGEGYTLFGVGKLSRQRGNQTSNPGAPEPLKPSTGKFLAPSITVYSRTASGDVSPVRRIQGAQTRMNAPMGVFLDKASNQLVVANAGDDSLLFFDRNASGDVAPVRILQGPATEMNSPHGVSIDEKRNELWVTNWEAHAATVYPRTAKGNVAPLRVIRAAPKGTPATGLGNVGALAYDPKRQEILAPN